MSMRINWFIIFILSLTLAGCSHPKNIGSKGNSESSAAKSEVQTAGEGTSPEVNQGDGNKEQDIQEPVTKTQGNPDQVDADKQDDQKSADTTQSDQKATGQISDKGSVCPKKTTGNAEAVQTSDGSADTKKESTKVNLSYYENFCYDGDHMKKNLCFINFGSAAEDQIHFTLKLMKYIETTDGTLQGTTDISEECLGTLHGDKVNFEFVGTRDAGDVHYDEHTRDKGGGTLKFDGDDILVKTIVERKGSEVCHIAYPEYRVNRIEYMGNFDNSYILPDSSNRYLTEKDLKGISKQDLYYARNEIYARHEHGFDNPRCASYFYKKTWYADPDDQDTIPSKSLNDYEIKNINLMKRAEDK